MRPRRAERAALICLVVTLVLVVGKFAVWRATGSLAVLSQALDSLLDIVALGVVYLGVRVAGKPADESHHYGHGKAENLAAFAQTILIAAVVVAVGWESLRRLVTETPEVGAPWYALALLMGSIGVDAVRVAYLSRVARAENSDALRAGALNIAGDLGTASVALVTLVFVRAGSEIADPIGALIVVTSVGVMTVRLAKGSVDVLMDRAPSHRVQQISAAAAGAPGVQEARRVRLRGTADNLFADVTVTAGRTASLERAHDIAEGVEREIERVAPGTDVVVHVEPVAEMGNLVERVQAAAGRVPGVHEIHNVHVHAFSERGTRTLHVTLHAKVQGALSVEEAHSLADQVEAQVAGELDTDVRVDTHLEPLESTTFGTDVTEMRRDVVESLLLLARRETDIIDCHDVVVTDTAGELAVIAHVTGRASLPLSDIHAAANRIETTMLAEHPEVTSVVLHFEPPDLPA